MARTIHLGEKKNFINDFLVFLGESLNLTILLGGLRPRQKPVQFGHILSDKAVMIVYLSTFHVVSFYKGRLNLSKMIIEEEGLNSMMFFFVGNSH